MKKIILILLAFALLVGSCGQKAKQQNTEEQKAEITFNAIYITYNQPINGYKVEVVFKPEDIQYENIKGNATLTFEAKNGKKFILTNNYFGLSYRNFSDLSEDKFNALIKNEAIASLANGQTYKLDYDFPKNNTDEVILNEELPFFFADVNLDGRKELILTEMGEGQRGFSKFLVIFLTTDGNIDHVSKQKPFNILDGLSKIDKKKRQIIIHSSNGADTSYDEVYIEKENKWVLKNN